MSSAPVAARRRSVGQSLANLANSFIAGVAGHRPELVGDALPRMSWRLNGFDVGPRELLNVLDVRHAGHARIPVAIYVHGLFIDESNWWLGPSPLPEVVERGLGWAPLCVRYNSGQHVSYNGDALADLIEGLAAAWGERLGAVQIFAHSMGGLVTRSALHALQVRSSPVLAHIDRVFLLAVPNQGADLERLGHAIESGLGAVDAIPALSARLMQRSLTPSQRRKQMRRRRSRDTEIVGSAVALPTVPIRTIRTMFSLRSDGIRDVRFGYMLQSEWQSEEQERHRFMLNHRRPVPPPPGVRVYCIAGSLWPDVGSAPSRIRNDGMVSTASAAGKGGDFDDLRVVEAGRFAEIPLLAHQIVPASSRVWDRVRYWVEHDL